MDHLAHLYAMLRLASLSLRGTLKKREGGDHWRTTKTGLKTEKKNARKIEILTTSVDVTFEAFQLPLTGLSVFCLHVFALVGKHK